MKKKNIFFSADISRLAANIRRELRDMELDVKGRVTIGYWRVGRWVGRDILKNKNRAGYGEHLYRKLAPLVSLSERTLERTVRLYRDYPISSHVTKLTWTHFLHLMSVKDEHRREQLEHQAIAGDWDSQELKRRIKAAKAAERLASKKIPQLRVVRGQVNTFSLVEEEGETLVDLGFRVHREFEQIKSLRLKKDDCVAVRDDRFSNLPAGQAGTTSPRGREQLFSYKAQVKKIIDGDTLRARAHLNFGMFITQKFRLRGIDCPEMDTPEGRRAKRFVEERLNGLEHIVIKTYKDTTDKYERYLADVFYLPRRNPLGIIRGLSGETDLEKIAQTGNYLNQELLDAGLARAWAS